MTPDRDEEREIPRLRHKDQDRPRDDVPEERQVHDHVERRERD